MDVPLSSVSMARRPQHAKLTSSFASLGTRSRFGTSASQLDVAVNSVHLPSIDHSVKSRLLKQKRDADFILQRENRREERNNHMYNEIRTILPPKQAHHDKHLTSYQLLRRFEPGIHNAIIIRDEHVASLPLDMSMMHHITSVDIAGNKVTHISEGLVGLNNLCELDVSNNFLAEVPDTITCLSKLSVLKLRYNRIQRFPEVNGMISLEVLDLSHNLLEDLPLSINELRKLEKLDVRNCHLRYLPFTINDLRNTLREVLVDFNYIVDIPRKLGNMQGLRKFSLTQNLLRELRPGNLEALTNLEHLQINHNKMRTVPKTLGLCYGLHYLDLSNNLIEEPPVSLAVLTALTYLDVSNNRIQGLPSLMQLTTLHTLRCAYNHMLSLPMGIHKLTSLTHLDASHNPKIAAPPMSVVQMGLPYIMAYMHEAESKRVLRTLAEKKVAHTISAYLKKRERDFKEGFMRVDDSGSGTFDAGAFGVWTRFIGVSTVRASDVKLLFEVMNDHCGQTGLVPHEYIMEVFKRGGENLIKEMKGYVDENSKKWLEIERQKLVDLEMAQAAEEAAKARAETEAKMKARRREAKRKTREADAAAAAKLEAAKAGWPAS